MQDRATATERQRRDLMNNEFLTEEEKNKFSLGLIGAGTDIMEIEQLTADRRREANLKDLRNRMTQLSGFAGIQQRRTAMTRPLSPGQDNASRKGTTLITSRT